MALAQSISTDHFAAFIAGAHAGRYGLRDGALARIICDVGARPAELAKLTVGAVCDGAGNLTGRIRFRAMKKSGKTRDCKLAESTVAALREYLSGRDMDARAPLFTSERGGRLEAQSMRALIIAIGKRSGLSVSGYSFRHAVFDAKARDGMRHGLTVGTLATWSGHMWPSSLTRYFDANSSALQVVDAPTER